MNGNIYDLTHEMVQGQTFADVEATFYCGSDMAEKYFFEEWQKVSYNPQSYDLNYYKEYVGAVDIFALNEKNERTTGIRLMGPSKKPLVVYHLHTLPVTQ